MNDKVKALWEEVCTEYDRGIRPLYPHVVVQVLGQEQQTKSGLILPEKVKQKPMYEGIVVDTYQPTLRPAKGALIEFVSIVNIGDHVLFPHHVGAPYRAFIEHGFRLIREEDIAATVEYERKPGTEVPLTTSGV